MITSDRCRSVAAAQWGKWRYSEDSSYDSTANDCGTAKALVISNNMTFNVTDCKAGSSESPEYVRDS